MDEEEKTKIIFNSKIINQTRYFKHESGGIEFGFGKYQICNDFPDSSYEQSGKQSSFQIFFFLLI